jgi:hypothetical protein
MIVFGGQDYSVSSTFGNDGGIWSPYSYGDLNQDGTVDRYDVALHGGPVALIDTESVVRRLHVQAVIEGWPAKSLNQEIQHQLAASFLRVGVLAFPVGADLRIAV